MKTRLAALLAPASYAALRSRWLSLELRVAGNGDFLVVGDGDLDGFAQPVDVPEAGLEVTATPVIQGPPWWFAIVFTMQ